MTTQQLQDLFEKISDAYSDGVVECKHITSEYIDLQFLRNGATEVGHVRLFPCTAGVAGEGLQELIKVVDHYSGDVVFVSPVVSALIAVSTR